MFTIDFSLEVYGLSEQKSSVKTLPKRNEVPVEETWNLDSIFASEEEWEKEFTEIKQLLPKISEFQGKLTASAENLYEAFTLIDEISKRLGKLFVYAQMRSDEDTSNSKNQGLKDRAVGLATQMSTLSAYVVPELLTVSEEHLKQLIDEHKGLQVYAHKIDKINRQRPHVLSQQEEAILAQASEVMRTPSNTFNVLNNADLKFPVIQDEEGNNVEVTHGRYIQFLESKDRNVRKAAFHAMYSTYEKFINTFASTLSGAVKKNNFYASVRKYKDAREAALHPNNIPVSVYDSLVETINQHLHLLHRYVKVRKQLLRVDELHMYDLYVPLIDHVDMKFTYSEAKNIILEAFQPLGEEYVNTVKEGFENRWIDVHETVGKRSGAYSSGTYGTMPYILMNWQNNVDNLFTLAHELGHSMHSYYTWKHQPYPYANYSIFVAEVASTCNEALLNDYLIKRAKDKNEKLFLINHFLDSFRGTVFRQTMFAEFEQLIHEKAAEGIPLTPELLTEEYYKLNEKYFGAQDIHIDKEIGYEWARIPHFYYNFYVYQYATGYSAAAALAKQILEEGEKAVERYLDFLKAGSSDYPIEVLKKAGVDMTTKEPIENALKLFEEHLSMLEELLS